MSSINLCDTPCVCEALIVLSRWPENLAAFASALAYGVSLQDWIAVVYFYQLPNLCPDNAPSS